MSGFDTGLHLFGKVNNLDVQFRHYDFDGSGTLDLEAGLPF